VVDDIQKKLDIFSLHWKDGKLSEPVKLSMANLVNGEMNYTHGIVYCVYAALDNGDYCQADQIHVKLMVDHISEVSEMKYCQLCTPCYVSKCSFLQKHPSFYLMCCFS